MDIKFVGVLSGILLFFNYSCNPCDPDEYGEVLELIIPVQIKAEQDTIKINDTIHIDISFAKLIELNNNKAIRLDSFNFFSELFIIEISGSAENYFSTVDSIVTVGSLGWLPLGDALSRPIIYNEEYNSYTFKGSIILKDPGLYWIGVGTGSSIFDYYEHPALYFCDNNKRDRVEVFYENVETSFNQYENIFLKTNVLYLKDLTSFEEYRKVGSITVMVEE